MSALRFETEEERELFIKELSNHLKISVSGERSRDYHKDKETTKVKVTLYFDNQEISSDSDSF